MPKIKLTLSQETIAELDALAEEAETTRSETIRDLLALAMDTLADDAEEPLPILVTDSDSGEEFELDPKEILIDADGDQYFIANFGRVLKDGTWKPTLLPLEFEDEAASSDESQDEGGDLGDDVSPTDDEGQEPDEPETE